MERFVLRENIAHFQQLLTLQKDEATRATLRSLLLSAQRDLALADARLDGVFATAPPSEFSTDHRLLDRFQVAFQAAPHPYLLLDPRAGVHIVEINDAYGRATMTTPKAVVGSKLFDVFPDNPDDPFANGVANLFASLRIAAEAGKPHSMPKQRYDVRDPTGLFVERHWRFLNTPRFDRERHLVYLLHTAEGVTQKVLAGSDFD